MKMNEYFKSLIDTDNTRIIICDLNHIIIYMNDSAKEFYSKRGKDLLGANLLDCHNNESKEKILRVLEWFKKDINNNRVHTFYDERENKDGYMIALRNDKIELIGYYEKHEYRNKDLNPFYEI